jgi:hypothetical protein
MTWEADDAQSGLRACLADASYQLTFPLAAPGQTDTNEST